MAELRDLQTQKQIKAREKNEIASVRKQILALAQSVGKTVEQIMNVKDGQSKAVKTVPPRYQHPGDPAQQWSGRGRQPRWVKEYVGKPGNKLESLLIG